MAFERKGAQLPAEIYGAREKLYNPDRVAEALRGGGPATTQAKSSATPTRIAAAPPKQLPP